MSTSSLIHGFALLRETTLPELSSTVQLYQHEKTGAQLISIINDDENKSFGVGFMTPPDDDTGLPHILEHSVLAGSRKYPVKEPFVELLKTSVKTFLNAMTFADMTIYPVASTNLRDFYNLLDVYLDACFYPLIDEHTFMQEGWHHESDDPDAPLQYKGIVYNEMKAVYSTPEALMNEAVQTALLPDTPYAFDSGGNPSVIPDLTYEKFKQFHETYYHPSNARFFFYGDDNPEERLRVINEFISEFERKDIHVVIPKQPRFDAPRHVVQQVDAGEAAEEDNKALVTVNWLLNDATDTREVLLLQVLTYILLGTPASPLRIALLESGLGEDITGGGLESYQREVAFSVGMKGIVSEDSEAIETLILQTLGDLAENGIDPATIEMSLNSIEFDLREKNTGAFPRGLMAFMSLLPVWMHGGDPIKGLAFQEDFDALKQQVQDNPMIFSEKIGEYFLNNPHRVTVLLEPNPQVKIDREEAERQRLEAERAKMSADQHAQLIATQEALKLRQETPDSPEALATIPTLKLGDLDRKVKQIPREERTLEGTPTLYHDLATNGIVYLDVVFDLKTLPSQLLPYLGLFSQALTELGTHQEDYVRLTQRIGAKTGGIYASTTAGTRLDGSTYAFLMLRAKSLMGQSQEMLDILRDILLSVNFDDKERLRQMILENKVGIESYLPFGGQAFAAVRMRAHFDDVGALNEQLSGISQLFFLRDLATRLDSEWDSIRANFETIRETLINRSTLISNVTLDATLYPTFEAQLGEFIASLPRKDAPQHAWAMFDLPRYEGLSLPAQVNFVGKSANLRQLGYSYKGSELTISKYLNLTYLWNKIRAQGGAYGGSFGYDTNSGIGSFLSWRDPNISKTLENFDGAGKFLQELELSRDELDKAIIGAIGGVDKYQLPDAKGISDMMHYITGYDNAQRQQRRDEIFATTLAGFKAFGEILARAPQEDVVVVVGSPKALEDANSELATPMTITQVL